MAQNRWSQTPLGWCYSAKAKAGPARGDGVGGPLAQLILRQDLRHHFVVEHKVDLEVMRLLGQPGTASAAPKAAGGAGGPATGSAASGPRTQTRQ